VTNALTGLGILNRPMRILLIFRTIGKPSKERKVATRIYATISEKYHTIKAMMATAVIGFRYCMMLSFIVCNI
jgi:hypothetical protein